MLYITILPETIDPLQCNETSQNRSSQHPLDTPTSTPSRHPQHLAAQHVHVVERLHADEHVYAVEHLCRSSAVCLSYKWRKLIVWNMYVETEGGREGVMVING